MRKFFISLLMIFSLVLLAGCIEEEALKLPDLTGKTKQEVVNIFSGLQLTLHVEDVPSNEVTDGTFLSYGEGFTVGQVVEKGNVIVVNFAYAANVLPDLTGKNRSQIFSSLQRINVIIEIQDWETTEVEPGLFVGYADNLSAGDVVADGRDIVVYVAVGLPNPGLIISKYFEGTNMSKMIEIFNTTDAAIDLADYSIRIHRYVAGQTIEIDIPLTGMLASGKTFIIGNPENDAEMRLIADMETNDLVYNGREAITLTFQNRVHSDVFGTPGQGIEYANERTFVRNSNVTQASSVFNLTEWGIYAADNYTMFGTHPTPYPESFILEEQYKLLDYFTQSGGVVEVTLNRTIDGDTAWFNPHFLGDDRIRFVGIDTLELGTGGPLAWEAKDYVDDLLQNATKIYIQNDPTTGSQDSYGRYLGLVWADDILVNYMVVKLGYSQNNYSDPFQRLVFNGVSLHQWFINAETYAKDNHLGVHHPSRQ